MIWTCEIGGGGGHGVRATSIVIVIVMLIAIVIVILIETLIAMQIAMQIAMLNVVETDVHCA